MLDPFIERIYQETTQKWKEQGSDKKGFSIFYSPVIENPKIMILGYNPGGDESSFKEDKIEPPKQHDYFVSEYKLARNMKKIFHAAGLLNELVRSVKLNLIFFRSRTAEQMINKALRDFCIETVKEIIKRLKPAIIVTEGFQTFDELLKLFNAKEEIKQIEENKSRRIVRTGNINGNIKVIGLIHPSGSWGISDKEIHLMGQFIYRILNGQ